MGARDDSQLARIATNGLLIAGGVYLLYKLLTNITDKLGSASKQAIDNFVASPIAAAISWWRLPAPVNVTSKFIVQSSGAILDPNAYPIEWMKSTGARAAQYGGELPTVRYMNQTYLVGPRDERGNYPLVPAASVML